MRKVSPILEVNTRDPQPFCARFPHNAIIPCAVMYYSGMLESNSKGKGFRIGPNYLPNRLLLLR